MLVQFGGVLFQTSYDPPIPLIDWLIAVGFGAGTMLWQLLLIFLAYNFDNGAAGDMDAIARRERSKLAQIKYDFKLYNAISN